MFVHWLCSCLRPCVRSLTLFVRTSVLRSLTLFVRASVRSFVRSSVRALLRWCARSCICLFIHSSVRAFVPFVVYFHQFWRPFVCCVLVDFFVHCSFLRSVLHCVFLSSFSVRLSVCASIRLFVLRPCVRSFFCAFTRPSTRPSARPLARSSARPSNCPSARPSAHLSARLSARPFARRSAPPSARPIVCARSSVRSIRYLWNWPSWISLIPPKVKDVKMKHNDTLASNVIL